MENPIIELGQNKPEYTCPTTRLSEKWSPTCTKALFCHRTTDLRLRTKLIPFSRKHSKGRHMRAILAVVIHELSYVRCLCSIAVWVPFALTLFSEFIQNLWVTFQSLVRVSQRLNFGHILSFQMCGNV